MKNRIPKSLDLHVHLDPDRMGGEVVFRGTRVPVNALFDYLRAGKSINEFLTDFDGASAHAVQAVLAFAEADFSERASMPRILQLTHKFCFLHRDAVERSNLCGCFHCLQTFPPSEITDWLDDGPGLRPSTAQCPRCGIDAVLSDKLVSFNPALLAEMQRAYFHK